MMTPRHLATALLLALTAGCGGAEPDWNGDPSKCDRVELGACVRGLPPGALALVVPWASETFGPVSLQGYVVEGVGSGPCDNALGCHSADRMHIWVALDKPEWSWHPCLFPWILGHEVGHAAFSQQLGDSDNDHTSPVWQTWPSHLGEVCFPENPS